MAKNPNSPPHSILAEKSLLGALLNQPPLLLEVAGKERLKGEHFFVDLHKHIFEALIKIDGDGNTIDMVSTSEVLAPYFDRQYCGPLVAELMQTATLTENISYYVDIIKRNYYLRKIIEACHDTAGKAMQSNDSISTFLNDIEKTFTDISKEQDTSGGLVFAKDALISTLEEIEKRINSGEKVTGLSSGFVDLDDVTGGWQNSDLVILAARPGMGKTALALNWVVNALKKHSEIHIAVFTLEMSKEQLIERLISAEGRIDSTLLRKGDLSNDDQDRLMHAARKIHDFGTRLVIDETPGISLMELRARCRQYKKERRLDFIVIDYLQLMTGSTTSKNQGREREISEISMGLKGLAKEIHVPVIALAQLNRGPDSRPDKRPKISDLRESGSMEQDADQIMFVYRDEYYNQNSELAGKAEVLIAKNRHGETGSVLLAWLPHYVSFHNLARE